MYERAGQENQDNNGHKSEALFLGKEFVFFQGLFSCLSAEAPCRRAIAMVWKCCNKMRSSPGMKKVYVLLPTGSVIFSYPNMWKIGGCPGKTGAVRDILIVLRKKH